MYVSAVLKCFFAAPVPSDNRSSVRVISLEMFRIAVPEKCMENH